MRKLPTAGFPRNCLDGEEPVFVGLDIAVNREKGLRCSLQTPRSALWETTLKFRDPIRLQRDFPFISISMPNQDITPEYLTNTFMLTPEHAKSLSSAFSRVACIAIDGPPGLAEGNRRESELTWHNHIIPGIKDRPGGIYWTPPQSEVIEIVEAFFDHPEILTTEQVTKLGQSLWMFVGFWTHALFRHVGKTTIEVFPAAARSVCQHISESDYRQDLEDEYRKWGDAGNFQTFITTKSESNDAAIACFTAYLWTKGKTEEIYPNEVVVPIHQGQRFNAQAFP
jgi:hypothetical protein